MDIEHSLLWWGESIIVPIHISLRYTKFICRTWQIKQKYWTVTTNFTSFYYCGSGKWYSNNSLPLQTVLSQFYIPPSQPGVFRSILIWVYYFFLFLPIPHFRDIWRPNSVLTSGCCIKATSLDYNNLIVCFSTDNSSITDHVLNFDHQT